MHARDHHDFVAMNLKIELISEGPKIYPAYVTRRHATNDPVDGRIAPEMRLHPIDGPQKIGRCCRHAGSEPLERNIDVGNRAFCINDRKGHSLTLWRAAISLSVFFF